MYFFIVVRIYTQKKKKKRILKNEATLCINKTMKILIRPCCVVYNIVVKMPDLCP